MTTNSHRLRSCLQNEHRRLTKELEQLKATVRQAGEQLEGNPFGKWEEGAMDIFELERCLALLARMTDSLAEVERALHKFDSGTYGFCDSCGQPIDPPRLEALPQASLCLSCKAHLAKNAKVRSSPG